jgi:hypothetical protein
VFYGKKSAKCLSAVLLYTGTYPALFYLQITYQQWRPISNICYVSTALTPLQTVRYMKHTCTLTKLHVLPEICSRNSVKLPKNQAKTVNPFKKSTRLNLKWFQKLILCPKVRRKPMKKRSIHTGVVCEHFEEAFNAAFRH